MRKNKKNKKKKEINIEKPKIVNVIPSRREGEFIAHRIINKIISLAIIKTHIKDVYKYINEYMFNIVKNKCNNFLSINLINYGEDNIKLKGDSLYNNWDEVSEPSLPNIDRYMSTIIKVNKNINERYYQEEDEEDGIIKEHSEISNELELSSNLLMSRNKNLSNKDSSPKSKTLYRSESEKTISSNIRNIKKSSESSKNIFDYKNILKNKKKNEIIDISKYDIDPSEFRNSENDIKKDRIVDHLISEYNREKQKILKEKQMQMQREKDNNSEKKKINIINSEKYTFDQIGKIIRLRRLDLAKLKGNFLQLEACIKKENFKKKIQRGAKYIQGKEEVIYNSKGNDTPNISPILKEREGKVVLSGDNFNLFFPETGVILKGGTKSVEKKGGMNFYRKYNKYSFENFSNISQSMNSINYKAIEEDNIDKNSILKDNNRNKKEDESKEEKLVQSENKNLMKIGFQNEIEYNPLEENSIKIKNYQPKLIRSLSQQSMRLTNIGQINFRSTLIDSDISDIYNKDKMLNISYEPKKLKNDYFGEISLQIHKRAETKRLFRRSSFSNNHNFNLMDEVNKSLIKNLKLSFDDKSRIGREDIKKQEKSGFIFTAKRKGVIVPNIKSPRIKYANVIN